MPAFHLADATNIARWADGLSARGDLPELVRRLIQATARPSFIEFRAGEGTQYEGWDGRLECEEGNSFVPSGASGWEMGTDKSPKTKADSDYAKRTGAPDPFGPAKSAFVFVTPRRFNKKGDWIEQRRAEGVWQDVRVVDADDLATWLAKAPGVHVWLSLRMGLPIEHVQDVASWWEDWRALTAPPISTDLLMSGREAARDTLLERLTGPPGIVTVRAESEEEALAFVAATVAGGDQEALVGRALLIESPAAWRQFASEASPLVLVPRFSDPALRALAVRHGHHVVLPVGTDYRLDVSVNVPRLSAWGTHEVLEKEGLTSADARYSAGTLRRSLAAYRRIRAASPPDVPEWARGAEGLALAPLVLLGSWNEDRQGDRERVEQLTGRSYADARAAAARWKDRADAPFRLVGTRWRVNEKEDTWRLLAPDAPPDLIQSFTELVLDVLPQPDPKRGRAEPGEWFIQTDETRRLQSSALRDSLADSLAMLGALGERVPVAGGVRTTGYAAGAARRLLEKAREARDTWLDLASHLPDLAEADPDTFLSTVEADLKTDAPTLLVLFEEQPGFLTPNYEHPHLLWALERLAWSPDHFARVAVITAHLAELAPSTRIVNSPFDTLTTFFRLWLPQCGASAEQRLEALDHLRPETPGVAWRLLRRLLPTGHDSTSIISGPGARSARWRNWPAEAARPTGDEHGDAIRAVSERLLEDVQADPARWLDLAPDLHHLHPAVFEEAMRRLTALPETLGDADLRLKLWHLLRDFVANHRAHKEADWALLDVYLSQFERVVKALAPSDPVHRSSWLFAHYPKLPVPYQQADELLARLRMAAIQDVLASGVESLCAFAGAVENPDLVGDTLARMPVSDADVDRVIAGFGGDDVQRRLAYGVVWRLSRERGETWIAAYLGERITEGWQDDARAYAYRALPLNTATLNLVNASSEGTQRHFWQQLGHFWTDDADTFDRAMDGLILFDRPRRALDILAMRCDGPELHPSPALIERALIASIEVPLDADPTHISAHDAARLLRYLKDHPDANRDRVESLEWLYLPLIDRQHGTLLLHERLAADPSLFVEAVGLLYRRDNDEAPAEPDKTAWERAYHLLSSWHSVPGIQPDGTLDRPHLKDWVRRAMDALRADRRELGGILAIGQMLQRGPGERDGVWPDPAVCDLIEELASDALDDEFRVAVYNSRGTTSRGPYDGGGQERALASKFDGYAASLNGRWPRVAAIMRRLAEGYRAEGVRNDHDAEVDEDTFG